MRGRQEGFTLLEVMIVIAIIAIMLVIAVPVYQDYSVRARVAECVALQAPIKLKISEAVIDEKRMPPADEVAVNRTTPWCDRGTYVRDGDDAATVVVNVNESAVGVEGGLVEARIDARRCGNDDVEWSCYYASSGGDTTQGRYLPVSCRTTSVEFSDTCVF